MHAMIFEGVGEPLRPRELATPRPGDGQVLIRVRACGVCRTDLHIVDGELKSPKLPLILGHQVVGIIERVGARVVGLEVGDRVGVPWLAGTCGHCARCERGRENLCDDGSFTGYDVDGGFAEYMVADPAFVFPLRSALSDLRAAPLLCGGLIGYRALRAAGAFERIGFYGFGSAAHILTQVVRHQGGEVYAFLRPGDAVGAAFARELGAAWAGPSDQPAPVPLDAAIIFAPAGPLVPAALRAIDKGGTVVCAGIHMSDIPSFPYDILWGERVVRSIANLTRRDGEEFLAIAAEVPIETRVTVFPLAEANEALGALRDGRFEGSAVIEISRA